MATGNLSLTINITASPDLLSALNSIQTSLAALTATLTPSEPIADTSAPVATTDQAWGSDAAPTGIVTTSDPTPAEPAAPTDPAQAADQPPA